MPGDQTGLKLDCGTRTPKRSFTNEPMTTNRRKFARRLILAFLAPPLPSEVRWMQALESLCGSVEASEAVAIEDVGHP
jgi:hypothetical protein